MTSLLRQSDEGSQHRSPVSYRRLGGDLQPWLIGTSAIPIASRPVHVIGHSATEDPPCL